MCNQLIVWICFAFSTNTVIIALKINAQILIPRIINTHGGKLNKNLFDVNNYENGFYSQDF